MNIIHKNIRLKQYDYSQPGAYFVTICTWKRKNLFGEIVNGAMQLNQWGEHAKKDWEITGCLRKEYIENDIFIIMPNHLHGIIVITKQITKPGMTAKLNAPIEQFGKPRKGSLSSIIQIYKTEVTKAIRYEGYGEYESVWQPGYYEHIIRDDQEFNLIEEYIRYNPSLWDEDNENLFYKPKDRLSELDKILKNTQPYRKTP